jgi:hypothetical protein
VHRGRHVLARAIAAALDRAVGHTEDLRRFGSGQPAQPHEGDRVPLAGGQGVEQPGEDHAGVGGGVVVGVPGRVESGRHRRRGSGASPAESIDGAVASDGPQPPTDDAVDLEVWARQGGQGADPGRLDDIGGVLVVVQDPTDHRSQGRVVASDQPGDGLEVVVLAVQIDQLDVAELVVT